MFRPIRTLTLAPAQTTITMLIPIKTLQQTLTPIQTLAIQPLTTLTPTTTLIHLRLLLIQP
jgi:hypothetical protein